MKLPARIACCLTAALAAAVSPIRAADPPEVRGDFDAQSGRGLLNYAPHRAADIEAIKLEVTIPDMNARSLNGMCTLIFTPLGRDVALLPLHAGPPESMKIVRIMAEGEAAADVKFTHQGESLDVSFAPPIPLGKRCHLVIEYTLADPPEGLIWTTESPAWPGRPAQIHSQGEPESNRYWFPSYDFPNERFRTELYATVPTGFTVISNGVLASQSSVSTANGEMESFHWVQAREHVNYLVSMVVGRFESVELDSGRLPMPVYVAHGQAADARRTFSRTPRMVALFERLIDEPYPWDKYAQVCVLNFAWGGMENTSATTLYETAPQDAAALLDGDIDGLISHELAHQWFGDLITCRSWDHIWLNEGFATYFEKLWDEYRESSPGAGAARLKSDEDAYLWGIWQDYRGLLDVDAPAAPFQCAMMSKQFLHPIEVFDREANPYPKGAAVLHMLRRKLGDALFFRALVEYVDRHKDESVETFDFRKSVEATTGLSLQRFLDQWCARPGLPSIEVSALWDSAASALTVSVEQTQKINGANPAFAFALPVWIRTGTGGAGQVHTLTIDMETRSGSATIELPREPTIVAVDPHLDVLARVRVTQPESRWIAQLESGPTLAARLQAADHLGRMDATQEAISALASAVADERLHHGLRSTAAESLGTLANPQGAGAAQPSSAAMAVLHDLVQRSIDDARVRRTLVKQTARASLPADVPVRERAAFLMAQKFRQDPSPRVRAEAIRGLGTLKATDHAHTIQSALNTESFDDLVRQAAIEAIADLDLPEGLDLAIRLAAPGTKSFTRPIAVRAVGKLHRHEKERAFNVLAALLDDREPRTAGAALETLSEFPDPRVADILRHRAANSLSRQARAEATAALRKLEHATPEKAAAAEAQ